MTSGASLDGKNGTMAAARRSIGRATVIGGARLATIEDLADA
jgi:hypothetical protein